MAKQIPDSHPKMEKATVRIELADGTVHEMELTEFDQSEPGSIDQEFIRREPLDLPDEWRVTRSHEVDWVVTTYVFKTRYFRAQVTRSEEA